MDLNTFAAHARDVIEQLPPDLKALLHNVAVLVEDWPTRQQLREQGLRDPAELFGLYEGLPLTERGVDYGLVLPDRILLFRGPHLLAAEDEVGLLQELRTTILHELAHHFGIDDERLQELGAY